MRHRSMDLTMNAYTDLRLIDVAGALNALPELPLDAKPIVSEEVPRLSEELQSLRSCRALAVNR